MITFDSETCGLHGVPVLFQHAVDDGPVVLTNVWKKSCGEIMDLIEWYMEQDFCGFNLAFDHFHINKFYTMLYLLRERHGPKARAEDHIQEMVDIEEQARHLDICVKPKRACDVLMHVRKGKYQTLMDRKDIRIRKIPAQMAEYLRQELERRVHLDQIYFAKKSNPFSPQWNVYDRPDDGDEWKDVVLKFRPSAQLKVLAQYALKIPDSEILRFADVDLPDNLRPQDKKLGYVPVAKLQPSDITRWPDVLQFHIDHWAHNPLARKYGGDDVVYTRSLWKHLDCPEPGDVDSELACMVACVRWRGFDIDIEGMRELRERAVEISKTAPKAPRKSRVWLEEVMSEAEQTVLGGSTKKTLLENIEKWECDSCDGGTCDECDNSGRHPASIRAGMILAARKAAKEVENYDKLIQAGRFQPSFSVIGALSGRMSGGKVDDREKGSLNSQGIKKTKEVRSKFTLAGEGEELWGGDFDSFEVALMVACYKDPDLEKVLAEGKIIHALFAQELFPELSYDEIVASDGKDPNYYLKGKSGVYAMAYGGVAETLKDRLGVSIEVAEKAYQGFARRFPVLAAKRQEVSNRFCSMQQPHGPGTKVIWKDPADSIATLFGFQRFFTLENSIVKALYTLAQKPPKGWREVIGKVKRREHRGYQTVSGATQSALYAAAFAVQAANTRAAVNHVIQGSGARITKEVQINLWKLQPSGAHPWRVRAMNIHDEIMSVMKPEVTEEAKKVVDETVESYRDQVPMITMDWKRLETWASK